MSHMNFSNLLLVWSVVVALFTQQTVGYFVDLLSDDQIHTTGLFWDCDNQVLLYVDRVYNEIRRYDIEAGVDTYIILDQSPSFVIPTRDYNRRFIIGEGNDLVYLFWDYDDDYDTDYYAECLIATVDYYCPGNVLNDGKADFYGNIKAGTFPQSDSNGVRELHQGSLYSFDTSRPGKAGVTADLRQVNFANDVAWTSDYRVMYFSESDSACIYSFNYDLITGTICNCETIFCLSDYNITGFSNGITIDTDGNLWIAVDGGGSVLNVNPNTQELLEIVPIPVSAVTDVEFGGPDLDILFVSTKVVGDPLEPLAGSIFQVTDLGVEGYCSNYAVMNSDCTPEYFT